MKDMRPQSGQYLRTQVGQDRYRWYQSHTLVGSVGPTHEDACAYKGVDCGDPKGGLAIHGIPYRLGKHMEMCL